MPPSVTFAASAVTNTKTSKSVYTRPQKKQKMTTTQTYLLTYSARSKLSREAARPNSDLRLLVGHANMLDSLMDELARAEREEEGWMSRSVSGADEEDEESEPESDESCADDDFELDSSKTSAIEAEDDSDADLSLTRTTSRHSPPPELCDDLGSDSEDEEFLPSPPNNASNDHLSELFSDAKKPSEHHDYFLRSRTQPTIIAAC